MAQPAPVRKRYGAPTPRTPSSSVDRLLKRANDQHDELYELSEYPVERLPDACYDKQYEMKHVVQVIRGTLPSRPWYTSPQTGALDAYWPMDIIQSGPDALDRVGDKVRLRGFRIHGQFEYAPTFLNAAGAEFNLVLFLDKQANEYCANSATQAYASIGHVFTSTFTTQAEQYLPNLGRYQILAFAKWKTRPTWINAGGATTADWGQIDIRRNCDIPVWWSTLVDVNTSLNLITRNRLVIMVGGSTPGLTDDYSGIHMDINIELYWHDDI